MIAHSLGKGKEPLRNYREAQEFLLNVIDKNYLLVTYCIIFSSMLYFK